MSAADLYGSVVAALSGSLINWSTHTIKLALLSSSYTPDLDTHDFFNDVSGAEITGTGYTPGGKALTSKSIVYEPTLNASSYKADSVTWDPVTLTGVRYAVLYSDTGSAGTSPLIALIDFGSDQSATAEPFVVAWQPVGIFTITLRASPTPAEAAADAAISAAVTAIAAAASISLNKYAINVPATNPAVITHNLGNLDVLFDVYVVATGEKVEPDAILTDVNTLTLTFGSTPGAGEFRCVVIG